MHALVPWCSLTSLVSGAVRYVLVFCGVISEVFGSQYIFFHSPSTARLAVEFIVLQGGSRHAQLIHVTTADHAKSTTNV